MPHRAAQLVHRKAPGKAALARRLQALARSVASASDAGGRSSKPKAALSATLTALAAQFR
jgi:hypothetical protein